MKPFLIGITGGSGSGKTTFLRQITEKYRPDQLSIISMDNYYWPRSAQQYDENGVQNFDLFDSIDTESFYNDILSLLEGKSIYKEEYDFNNSLSQRKTLEFKPTPIIIVEGLFVMHMQQLRPHLNLKVFVEAKDGLKIIRRIKRDQSERNYPIEDVLYRYEVHVLPSYEKFILPYKSEVDIIVNNNINTNKIIDILIVYLNHILEQSKSINS